MSKAILPMLCPNCGPLSYRDSEEWQCQKCGALVTENPRYEAALEARWAKWRAAHPDASTSPTTPRSAEEIAREMVSDDHETSCEESWSTVLGVDVPLPTDGIDKMRATLTAAIEQARADGAAAALAAQQPRDLAGRIRALVQEYAGRWADTDAGDTLTRVAIQDIMRVARLALADARSGVPRCRA